MDNNIESSNFLIANWIITIREYVHFEIIIYDMHKLWESSY